MYSTPKRTLGTLESSHPCPAPLTAYQVLVPVSWMPGYRTRFSLLPYRFRPRCIVVNSCCQPARVPVPPSTKIGYSYESVPRSSSLPPSPSVSWSVLVMPPADPDCFKFVAQGPSGAFSPGPSRCEVSAARELFFCVDQSVNPAGRLTCVGPCGSRLERVIHDRIEKKKKGCLYP